MQTATDDTLDDNTAVVERFVTDVWSGADPDAVEQLAIPDLVVHQLAAETDLVGRDEFAAFERDFREAVPDMRQTITQSVAEGEYVAALLRVQGTPEKPFQALRPTGKSFDVPGFQLYRLEDGRVAEVWVLINAVGVMQQLDLLPDSPGKVLRLVLGQVKQRLTGR